MHIIVYGLAICISYIALALLVARWVGHAAVRIDKAGYRED